MHPGLSLRHPQPLSRTEAIHCARPAEFAHGGQLHGRKAAARVLCTLFLKKLGVTSLSQDQHAARLKQPARCCGVPAKRKEGDDAVSRFRADDRPICGVEFSEGQIRIIRRRTRGGDRDGQKPSVHELLSAPSRHARIKFAGRRKKPITVSLKARWWVFPHAKLKQRGPARREAPALSRRRGPDTLKMAEREAAANQVGEANRWRDHGLAMSGPRHTIWQRRDTEYSDLGNNFW